MRNPELFLYRLIVRMHPAAFRQEFGREMLLDFEDSVAHQGIPRIFLDALLSAARQWTHCALSGGADRSCAEQPSLLAGQYASVRNPPLNPLELSRGLAASLLLLGLCGYSLSHGASRIRRLDVVYAASQGARAAECGAAGQTSGGSSAAGTAGRQFKEFDVISIRENKSGAPPHLSFPMSPDDYYLPTHGYMRMEGLPALAYIQFAYRMNALQVVALRKQLPDWATSSRYDIEARVDGDPTKDDMRTMVRALLASRFGLRVHEVTQTDNVYDLVLLKPGKLGPSLRAHSVDDPNCKQTVAPAAKGFFSPCGTIGFSIPDPNTRSVRMAGRNVSLSQFVWYASTEAGRNVLDKTGLTGKYDFTLEFAPQKVGGGPDPNASEPVPGAIFPDAVEEQMGLKLVPGKGPVTTYVLDHVERPTEN